MALIDGAVVKELRALRGLSQPKLAEQSGVSLLTVKRIEKRVGAHERRFDTVIRLSRALGVELSELCGDKLKEKRDADQLFLLATGMTRVAAIQNFYQQLGERLQGMTNMTAPAENDP
jgi:transcriptional regulator with XRE-family HTH domain